MARHARRHETPTAVRVRIAERLRSASRERDIDKAELSAQTGIALRLVYKHLSGDNVPSLTSLSLYSQALDKPVSWFLEEREAA